MGKDAIHFDWLTTILILCLSFFGLFLLLTINQSLFYQQLFYIVIGAFLLVGFSKLDAATLWALAPASYVISCIFLVLTYFGPHVRGAARWIFIGGVQFQPSELVKPFLLLAFARLISQYSPRTWRYLPLHFILFFIPFILVFKQPDLGTSLVYLGFWMGMMLAGGLALSLLAIGGIFFVVVLPIIWKILAEYQKKRILTFLDPELDPVGAGYNAIQAMIAVGSGGFWGRGLGRGTQSHLRFLPEFHTDFIFATLVEELGFLGGLGLLLGYLALLWRILTPLIMGKIKQIFPFIYTIGLFSTILVQIFINSGMNMGIIPVTGITLPFVSYGGSSILSFSVAFGLLWAVRRNSSQIEVGNDLLL